MAPSQLFFGMDLESPKSKSALALDMEAPAPIADPVAGEACVCECSSVLCVSVCVRLSVCTKGKNISMLARGMCALRCRK